MGRDYQIAGEALVRVKFGAHISKDYSNITGAISNLSELGLSSDSIRINPRFVHTGLNVDDYGPDVVPETLWMMADCQIGMTLVHYDRSILDFCLAESTGGTFFRNNDLSQAQFAGTMQPAGKPLGANTALLASGNHYISMSILAPQSSFGPGNGGTEFPWHFPACRLTGPAVEIPLGTEKSMVRLNWLAIPYDLPEDRDVPTFGEVISSGRVLFDHSPDLT